MSKKIKLPKIEYYTLEEAAEELSSKDSKVTVQNLLHWGALGRLEICGVLNSSNNKKNAISEKVTLSLSIKNVTSFAENIFAENFTWEQLLNGLYATSNKGCFFSLKLKNDKINLQCLNFMFCAIPPRFLLEIRMGGFKKISRFRFPRHIKYYLDSELPCGENYIDDFSFVGFFDTLESFTIETKDLFIMSEELEILKQGGKQIENNFEEFRNKEPHGNTINNTNKRNEVLQAAIYCKHHFPDQCTNGAKWAKTIDEKAPLFWKEGVPPSSQDVMSRMINDSLKTVEEKEKKQK